MDNGGGIGNRRFIYLLYNIYLLYMADKDKYSTIRVKESTKIKLVDIDFAKKDMSFEEIILELIQRHKQRKI